MSERDLVFADLVGIGHRAVACGVSQVSRISDIHHFDEGTGGRNRERRRSRNGSADRRRLGEGNQQAGRGGRGRERRVEGSRSVGAENIKASGSGRVLCFDDRRGNKGTHE